MILWIDAQLSPCLGEWIQDKFSIRAIPVRDLGLRDADDKTIFSEAKNASAIVMTKDRDFTELLDRFGPPPQVIWITCGNTSNVRLKKILEKALPPTISLLEKGEKLVEIGDS